MSHPSKASVTDVPKTYNPRTGKGHKGHLSNVKTKTVQQINKDISAHTIQRAWLSHMDKAIFQLLKHTICAAAMFDACRIMGEKKFYHQIMEDEHLFQKFKITDKIDIVTLQDYMQELQMDAPDKKQQQTVVFSTPSFDIVKVKELTSGDKLEKGEKELFAWCQYLYINSSPSF